jgi:hypothetical protein
LGGGAGEAPDDGVAVGDELDELHAHVGKRGAEAAEPVPHPGGQARHEQLLDHLVATAVDRLLNETPDRIFPVHRGQARRPNARLNR